MIELYALLAFMALAALVAVENHNLLSSVIAVGAVGFGLCLVFLMLGAPELAMVQLVVEIIALIILIRATINTAMPDTYKGRELAVYALTISFIAVLSLFAFFSLSHIPKFMEPIMNVAETYITEGPRQTGALNTVAAIALRYRLLDMLGAVAVLFAAIIGATAVLREKGRKNINERDETDS